MPGRMKRVELGLDSIYVTSGSITCPLVACMLVPGIKTVAGYCDFVGHDGALCGPFTFTYESTGAIRWMWGVPDPETGVQRQVFLA